MSPTLVTVQHFGWDALSRDHVSRHGFPLGAFQHRLAEWWQSLLDSLRIQVTAYAKSVSTPVPSQVDLE